MNSLLNDNISGIRQIKTYALEKSELNRFNRYSGDLKKANLNVMSAWGIYLPSMVFVSSIGFLIIIYFGGHLAIDGKITAGELTKLLILIQYLHEPMWRLNGLNQLIQSGRAAASRVFEILDTKEESYSEDKGKTKNKISGHIKFKDLSFNFEKDKKTLNKLNFEIKPGETVALVGSTGAGKSTIVNLIPRFYEFTDGDILLDNVSIKKYNKSFLRENIGYVTQESFMFNGTIRENLEIAKRDATEDELWQVLKAANAHKFVKKTKNGLDTNIGERGVKLSVGEKQRLSIARALLKNPPVLILDEATASVDNETEMLIQEALDHLIANRTSIVIAHRLSTIKNANKIFVIENGEIVETGNHIELIQKNGYYKKLAEIGGLS